MKRVLRIVIPLVILVIGAVALVTLTRMKSGAVRDRPEEAAPVVQVVTVSPETAAAQVRATGVVRPAQEVSVSPEVGGRIIWQADELVPGGRFRQGEVMARIDPRDYQMSVNEEQSRVDQARLDLQTERARQRIARKEWEMLGKDPKSRDSSLALRKPHVETAREAVSSAQSAAARARLQVQRTYLRAPFDAFVDEESVEVGQVVQPGTPLLTLIGTEELWVTVSMPVEELGALRLPAQGHPGSRVTVVQNLAGGNDVVRQGHVERLASSLDPETRTAQVLVTVPRPFDVEEGALPLLPGAFVDVLVEGRAMENVYRVPRAAITEGDLVWIVDDADTLQRRQLEIAWKQPDAVYASAGLGPGDRVVTTPLALPVAGMKVRVSAEPPQRGEQRAEAPTRRRERVPEIQ